MAAGYLEVFLLRNACADAGLLWLAALWRGGRVVPGRIALGALVGTAWALAAALAGGAFRSPASQGAASLAMVLVGVGSTARGDVVKAWGALWLGAAVLGGVATMGGSLWVGGVATGFAGAALLRRKHAPPGARVMLMVRQGLVSRTMEALVDTGNRALDPVTGLPAVLVPEGLFSGQEGRVLGIRTAAGSRALPCFTPEELTVDGAPARAVVAIAPRGMLECPLVPGGLWAERVAR